MSRRIRIFGAAALAALSAFTAFGWDFLYETPLGGRWVRSDNSLAVENCAHKTEERLTAMVEELGDAGIRVYTVWDRREWTCVDGSVAVPDGYEVPTYSAKTNAMAIAAHLADHGNPHKVTSRQADAAGGAANGLTALLAERGVSADAEDGVARLEGNGDALDFGEDAWTHGGSADFAFSATNATMDFQTPTPPEWNGTALATTSLVAEARSVASEALSAATSHAADTNNPHRVTAAQIGALTAESDPVWSGEKAGVWQSISNLASAVDAVTGGATGSVSSVAAELAAHEAATNNPHHVTAPQIGALTEEADPVWAAASAWVEAAFLSLSNAVNMATGGTTGSVAWVSARLDAAEEALLALQGKTNAFTEAVYYNGGNGWHVYEPVDFEDNVLVEGTVSARNLNVEHDVEAESLTLGGITVTNWDQLTASGGGAAADLAAHVADTNNPHQVTFAQLDSTHALRRLLEDKYGLDLSEYPREGVSRLMGWSDYLSFEEDLWHTGGNFQFGATNGTWDFRTKYPPTYNGMDLATVDDVESAVDAHAGDTTNPHGVTAAQVGALPTVGGTMANGSHIYFGNGNAYIHGTSNGITLATGGNILFDAGITGVNGLFTAPDGVETDSLKLGDVTVTSWTNLPDFAANAAHRDDWDNPHHVNIWQLDTDGEVRDLLVEKYKLSLDADYGLSTVTGFGHYISPEESLWEYNGFSDLRFDFESSTVAFETPTPPKWNGTNLATVADVQSATNPLASQTYVTTQIATAINGKFPSLSAYNAHVSNTNAHGLAAIREQLRLMASEDYVIDRIDDLISDYELDELATEAEVEDMAPSRAVYEDATNALWAAMAGMATDADIAAATNGLASQTSVTALSNRVDTLELAAFGTNGVELAAITTELASTVDRVTAAEADLAELMGTNYWSMTPAPADKVVFPKPEPNADMASNWATIDPGFYDRNLTRGRGGAISNFAKVEAWRVEAQSMTLHGDPVLASTQFRSNVVVAVVSTPRTFTPTNGTQYFQTSYPDYIGKMHFTFSNATYVATVTNSTVTTNGQTITTNETVSVTTNHYASSVMLAVSGTNMAGDHVSFSFTPELTGKRMTILMEKSPLYLPRGFYITSGMNPVPMATQDPVLTSFSYEIPATYGEQHDLYGKSLYVDEPTTNRGVANKQYVDKAVAGVDLHGIYSRDRETKLNGHAVTLNPRYRVETAGNDMTVAYGGQPVLTLKGGTMVVPEMGDVTIADGVAYVHCTGSETSQLSLQWCTNGVLEDWEDVPAARIVDQYMVDEYTWCTEVDVSDVETASVRVTAAGGDGDTLSDVEFQTSEGPLSLAGLFRQVEDIAALTNALATKAELAAHAARRDNPHQVTAAQTGAVATESDSTALAALATASNYFAGAIADIGENLPGLAEFAARLAALEAWRWSAHDGTAVTNPPPGANLTWMVLTNLGEYVWQDVAMDENATNAVFAGNNTPLWEESRSGTRLKWESNANMPVTRWRSVAMSANGAKAMALPQEGHPVTRTSAGVSKYAQDSGHDLYWNTAAVSWDGSRMVAVDDFTEWTVSSSGNWTAHTNQVADAQRYLDYRNAFAGSAGDILLSDDAVVSDGALRRFALVMADGTVVDGRVVLPDGISSNATVATRTPYNAPAAAYSRTGRDSWPTIYVPSDGSYLPADGVTNTHVTKLSGGPWVDVVRDGTAPHPLYVRTMAQWVETNRWNEGYYAHWTNNYLYMTNVVQTNTSGELWLYGDPVFGDTVFENVVQTQKVTTNMFRVNKGPWWSLMAYCGADKHNVTYTNYYVRTETGNTNEFVVTNQAYSVTNRFAEAYQPITGAGIRHWADAAVSKDAAMRRMWAVEADGKVWRMVGRSWQDGTWTAQDGQGAPGTNMWKQVVCSGGGDQAIVLGDCMVPCGVQAADGTELTANAWYFDGDFWYALWYAVEWPDGHVECRKWKKAFLSKDGYTAYLLPEGIGYVHKLSYQ